MSGAVQNPVTIGFAPQRPDLLSPQQLAIELGMSLRSLQRHHDARTGPPRVNLGRHVFYRRTTVEAWLAKREGFGFGGGTSHKKPVGRLRRNNRARRAA